MPCRTAFKQRYFTVYLVPSCSVQLSRYALAIPENDIVKNVQSDPSVSLPLTLPVSYRRRRRSGSRLRFALASSSLLLPLSLEALAPLPLPDCSFRFFFALAPPCSEVDLGIGKPFGSPILPRKEVIQPHLPIRLPCYDFTPVIDLTFGGGLLAVTIPTSGALNSHGVTGGVYKARERIHRGILIRDY